MQDEFNEYIKQNLQQHESAVDGDALWSAIASSGQLKKHRKRRAFFWLFLLCGSGFLFSSLLYFLSPLGQPKISALPIPTEGSSVQNAPSIIPNKGASQTTIIASAKPQATPSVAAPELTASDSRSIWKIKPVELPNLSTNNPRLQEINGLSNWNIETSNQSLKAINAIQNSRAFPALSNLPTLANLLEVQHRIPETVRFELIDDSSTTKPNPFSLAINAGAGLIDRKIPKISMDSLSTDDLYDSPTHSFNINALLQYQINKSFYIKSGLSYAQYSSIFDYRNTTEETEDREIVQSITYEANGTVSEQTGPGQVRIITNVRKKIYNYQGFLNIPLLVGYSCKVGRIDLFVEGGLAFNFAHFSKGQWMGPNFEIEDLGQADYFKVKNRFSYLGQAGVRYQLLEHWSVTGGIQYEKHGKVVVPRHNIDIQQQSIGLQLGLQYQF